MGRSDHRLRGHLFRLAPDEEADRRRGDRNQGVISRIVDASSDPTEVSYHYYVRFRTQEGEDIEALLSNYRDDLEEGQQVRIKYHPKYKENARLI